MVFRCLPLTPQEAYLLSRIDGALDLESLLKIGGGSRGVTAKTLYSLFSCGIVEWKTEGAATGHAGGASSEIVYTVCPETRWEVRSANSNTRHIAATGNRSR